MRIWVLASLVLFLVACGSHPSQVEQAEARTAGNMLAVIYAVKAAEKAGMASVAKSGKIDPCRED